MPAPILMKLKQAGPLLFAALLLLFVVGYVVFPLVVLPRIAEALGDQKDLVAELVKHTFLILSCAVAVSLCEQWFRSKRWLDEVGEAVERNTRDNFRVLASARALGISEIYKDRTAAEHDVLESIHKANHRLWLLGVSLTKQVELEKLCTG